MLTMEHASSWKVFRYQRYAMSPISCLPPRVDCHSGFQLRWWEEQDLHNLSYSAKLVLSLAHHDIRYAIQGFYSKPFFSQLTWFQQTAFAELSWPSSLCMVWMKCALGCVLLRTTLHFPYTCKPTVPNFLQVHIKGAQKTQSLVLGKPNIMNS